MHTLSVMHIRYYQVAIPIVMLVPTVILQTWLHPYWLTFSAIVQEAIGVVIIALFMKNKSALEFMHNATLWVATFIMSCLFIRQNTTYAKTIA